MIAFTVAAYLTTCGKHPERMIHVTPEIEKAASVFIERVNAFMFMYGQQRDMTSGFRDVTSNAACGGAKYSWHCRGKAVDLDDQNGNFGAWVMENEHALISAGLWAEDPKFTKRWVHLQDEPPRSGKRVFQP